MGVATRWASQANHSKAAGLVDTPTAPPEQRFAGDGVGLEAVGPQLAIASRRSRHLLEGIEPALASNSRLNVLEKNEDIP